MKSGLTDALVGLIYFALAAAALLLTRIDHGVAILWVANAVLLVRLRTLPLAKWPGQLAVAWIASALATATFGVGSAALGFALANVVEVTLATALLNRLHKAGELFETPQSVVIFVVIAGVLAPLVSGCIGATTAAVATHRPWLTNWVDWDLGHALGVLIATPMVFLVASGEFARWRRSLTVWTSLQTACLLALVIGVTVLVFWQNRLPLLFLTILPVLIATFMIGPVGASLSVVLVALVGGWLTTRAHGPVTLIRGSQVLKLQFFQFYLASTFLVALPIAGALKQRERLLSALRESERRYRLLADNITDAILSIGADGVIRYASPAVRDLAGFDPQFMVGRSALELVHPEDSERVQSTHRQALQSPGQVFTIDYRVVKQDGSVDWFETRTKAVLDAHGRVEGVVSAIREIRERKLLEQQLREAAETDPLTGLANRRAFIHHLKGSIVAQAAGKAASLAMIDLDFFKRVNDEHGHGVGDLALMLLADICRDLVRSNDIVARIGGEEFALILNGAEAQEASLVCDRLREKIAQCKVPVGPGRSISISASIGVASVRADGDCDELLAIADAALYRAKSAGRNRVVVAEP